jgi:hypothetical protein
MATVAASEGAAVVVEDAVEAWASAVAVHLEDVEVPPLGSNQRFKDQHFHLPIFLASL